MNKDKLQEMLSSLKDGGLKGYTHYNSKVLIIDGMNTFLRSFAIDNRYNRFGHHVGGISGFLKSIGYAIRTEQPSRVIIVFDGEGGATNRRYLYPEYKTNRNTGRLVNKMFTAKEEEDQAKINEIERLIDYLNLLPITVIAIDRLEADDVMGYLSRKIYREHEDSHICIMSSDNDFLQLINDRTYCYSPTKKKHYYEQEVIDEFKVHPRNYLVYKCFIGDTSDNVKGVHGVGKKRLLEMFPRMRDPNHQMTFDEIYETCEEPPKKLKLYDRVLEGKRILHINSLIMDLAHPNISDAQQEVIDEAFNSKPGFLRKSEFILLYRSDGLESAFPGADNWLDTFSILNRQ